MIEIHYHGEIEGGEFDDRVYIDSIPSHSLNKEIFDNYKNKEILIELWITTIRMDFFQLEKMTDINPENMHMFRLYSKFSTVCTKSTMLGLLGGPRTINNCIGNYLYLIVEEIE